MCREFSDVRIREGVVRGAPWVAVQVPQITGSKPGRLAGHWVTVDLEPPRPHWDPDPEGAIVECGDVGQFPSAAIAVRAPPSTAPRAACLHDSTWYALVGGNDRRVIPARGMRTTRAQRGAASDEPSQRLNLWRLYARRSAVGEAADGQRCEGC